MNLLKATNLILMEQLRIVSIHEPFNSAHEGYAVILEELDELWEIIKTLKNKDDKSKNEKLIIEAKQLGATAIRFLMDICEAD